MGDIFTTFDLIVFFAALIGAMVVGLIAGRKEETSEDYFLAGRKIPWWGVAGSIFGSNVSANHMVGMMGIGFSVGFAQAHFELGAIFGLLALCYGFLPVYRKLQVYTLSEYLGRRYDDRSRFAYAVIMIVIMAFVQMVPGLYIGSRTICVMLGDQAATQEIVAEPLFSKHTDAAAAKSITTIETVDEAEPATEANPSKTGTQSSIKLTVNRYYYALFIIALAAVAAGYTIFGGLKAVVWTDVIQSTLLLAAGILIAILTFGEIGGWSAMMAIDQAKDAKMHLYLPSHHGDLPWTGVLSGLLALHLYYWGTNQFIVQRALAARSDSEARMGIVAAGFLKLLIPFFAIGTGVAAYYLFQQRLADRTIAPDTAFPELVKLIIPAGYGLIGIIAAGLIGAILSSIDSMMNSAATIVTVDIYKNFINPQATDRQMILVGRLAIVVFVVAAAVMAIFMLDPNSEENFFLTIVDYSGYLIPGMLVAFIMGMFWRRGTGTGAFVTIIAGVAFSGLLNYGYEYQYGMDKSIYSVVTGQQHLEKIKVKDLPAEFVALSSAEQRTHLVEMGHRVTPINAFFGPKLNFFHRVVGVILLCILTHVIISLLTKPDEEKGKLVWTDLGGHQPRDLKNLFLSIILSIGLFALLGRAMYSQTLSSTNAGLIASGWTLFLFAGALGRAMAKRRLAGDAQVRANALVAILCEDRFWAGILCALAVFMHYCFY